jgi:DNA-directed RNA polymerase specialized sigma24 family protein
MAGTQEVRSGTTAADCGDVAVYGSLVLDGSAPIGAAVEIGRHLGFCEGCATYVDQMAKTRAVVGLRTRVRPGPAEGARDHQGPAGRTPGFGQSPATLSRHQAYLMTLARATDPVHADDLVQDTWDHFLGESPSNIPDRAALAAYLLERAREHAHHHEADAQAWAEDLVRHHPHNSADVAETEVPDAAGRDDWRALADLDVLDPDGDRAELYLPDLYADGPDGTSWTTPPAEWPTLSRVLGPDQEAETAELYSVVDAALDELPEVLADAVYLVDIEGHALPTASSLLGRPIPQLQRDLVRARNHVRGRVSSYLAGR